MKVRYRRLVHTHLVPRLPPDLVGLRQRRIKGYRAGGRGLTRGEELCVPKYRAIIILSFIRTGEILEHIQSVYHLNSPLRLSNRPTSSRGGAETALWRARPPPLVECFYTGGMSGGMSGGMFLRL